MEIYLVGGAVRDEQLGLAVKERDWCVVGATPDDLLSKGFRRVGKDFPVFLHPETNEEYALARTERKTAAGYHGFEFHTSPDVTIEDDLSRRDLTINAMARDGDGNLVDPFDGVSDLEHRLLRHVSDAFSEDPVRILRAAKFKARFASLGFELADETLALMREMVSSGEADALQPEHCGALAVVFPEIDALFGVPQPPEWHPEIDSGLHTMMVLEQAARLCDDIDVRFAALVHDLGKATTRQSELPRHHGHEARSVKLVNSLSERLPVPRACRELGVLVAEYHVHCHRVFELKASTILKVLKSTDAFRRPGRFLKFLLACEADARGRAGLEERDYPQATYFRSAFERASEISADQVVDKELCGADIGAAIDKMRLQAIKQLKSDTADQLP
jgi:tRNA nucleotidyltransferase (CCA-adding enzyme)